MLISRGGGRKAQVEGTLNKGTERGLEHTLAPRHGGGGVGQRGAWPPITPPCACLCPHPVGDISQLLSLYCILMTHVHDYSEISIRCFSNSSLRVH